MKEVIIGKQTWMSENLNVDKFSNVDPIMEATTYKDWLNAFNSKTPAWCYYDFDPANGEKYGKLYNFYALIDFRNLAPEGWHVPAHSEWTTLLGSLGGMTVAAAKMKSTEGWNDDDSGTNESGFSAQPGGRVFIDEDNQSILFDEIGKFGSWWSTTINREPTLEPEVFYLMLYNRDYSAISFDNSRLNDTSRYNPVGLSVRCVKD